MVLRLAIMPTGSGADEYWTYVPCPDGPAALRCTQRVKPARQPLAYNASFTEASDLRVQ
jgi:hypothetical protein